METKENTEQNQEVNENGSVTDSVQAEAKSASSEPKPSETDQLKSDLELQKNKYLYLYAEFETYKGRTIKERSDLIKFGNEGMIRELLNVVDNLDRAMEHANADNGKVSDQELLKTLLMGLKMVREDFKNTLAKYNVKVIESLGVKFDPEKHEAVAQEKNESVDEGTILKVHQQGYTLYGRLLRPARVVVATK